MIKLISFDMDKTLVKSTYADLVWLEGFPKIYALEKKIDLEKAKQFLLEKYDEKSAKEFAYRGQPKFKGLKDVKKI